MPLERVSEAMKKKKGVGIETKHEEESMKTGEKGNKKSGLEE
jgi:hypothetical protein